MKGGIQLYQTALANCPYLDNLQSCNHVVDPAFDMSPAIYDLLLDKGFRRSAEIVYKPACPRCAECKSTRIPVKKFKPNRSQRRAWSKISDGISMIPCSPVFNDLHFALYQKYTRDRHTESDMAKSGADQYMDFLTSSWCDTIFLEIRLNDELLAVAVTDRQPNSLSALYTFFDPDKNILSPGVIAILSQLKMAREYQLDWLYLGYWIEQSPKMSYKTNFRPIQYFHGDQWHLLDR